MMAGNCRPMEDLILEQYTYLFHLNERNSVEFRDEITELETKVHYLKSNLTIDSPVDKLLLGLPATYWMSLKNYNHKTTIQELRIPIFVMQGERDYQVTMKDYKLWCGLMMDKPNYFSKSYTKLNHLFLEGVGVPNPSEYMIQSTVPKYVVEDITSWIKSVK